MKGAAVLFGLAGLGMPTFALADAEVAGTEPGETRPVASGAAEHDTVRSGASRPEADRPESARPRTTQNRAMRTRARTTSPEAAKSAKTEVDAARSAGQPNGQAPSGSTVRHFMRARISLSIGMSASQGASSVNSDSGQHDVYNLPMPSPAVRFELPVAAVFILGAQASLFPWRSEEETAIGRDWHMTYDFGLLPKLRFFLNDIRTSEAFAVVPFGLSLDVAGGSGTSNRLRAYADDSLGWHVGLATGGYISDAGSWLGYGGHLGIVYHVLQHDWRYEDPSGSALGMEEVASRVFEFFIRGGVVFNLG